MSDQTNPGDAGDFRGSAADKRKDETVMVNADDLSNLVSNAKQGPGEAPQAAAPPAAESSSSRPIIIGVVGVMILLVLMAIIYWAR